MKKELNVVSRTLVILEGGASINRSMDIGVNAFWEDLVNFVKKVHKNEFISLFVCLFVFCFLSQNQVFQVFHMGQGLLD